MGRGDSIDIVIPLGVGSKNDNIELRYCLRGIQCHLSNVRSVYIIGERPKWISGIVWKSAKDDRSSRFKERNIYNKIKLACNLSEVSDNFLFMNDDHFLLDDFDATEFPYHYKCKISETMLKNSGNYRKTMNHTRKHLISIGKEELDFDTHCPIIYNKEIFLLTFGKTDWNVNYGYGIKSMYCGINGIEGELVSDCKIQKPMSLEEIKATVKGRQYFSVGDGGLNEEMKRFLNELYPTKSKYER